MSGWKANASAVGVLAFLYGFYSLVLAGSVSTLPILWAILSMVYGLTSVGLTVMGIIKPTEDLPDVIFQLNV